MLVLVMAIQPAKSSFSHAEITDILRTNTLLYKHEPAFPEYFVVLGMYLMDQAYVVAGERAANLEMLVGILAPLSKSQRSELSLEDRRVEITRQIQQRPTNNQLSSLLKQENQSRLDSHFDESQLDESLRSLDDSEAFEETDPHFLVPKMPLVPPANLPKGRLSDFKPVMSSTKDFKDIPKEFVSPQADEEFHEPKTDKLNENQIEEIRRQTQADFEIQRDAAGKPMSRGSSKMPPTATPVPRKNLPKIPNIPDNDVVESPAEDEKKKTLGRAQVYKVARDYRAKREDGEQCPSCGARTRGRAVCPSCGHIL